MNQPHPGNQWQQVPPHAQFGQPYPPGYYPPPPPPPKKNKTGLWVLLALLAVIVVVAGGVVAFKLGDTTNTSDEPAADDSTVMPVTLTMEVTGTGSSALVAYSDELAPPGDYAEVPLPWTYEGTGVPETAFYLMVKPTAAGDTVTCKVTFQGTILADRSTTDDRRLTCSGLVPGAR
ncbi:MmpS family transport accessory protein [Mycolicibacterium smegmatis]|uniref:Mycobacterium membrane protein n=1 Tax=Mycolicibacterium smegmatis (strain MKD8) TaxID=1214915 RepID=A0A2U9PUU0_MYCSE|nr:MmpS family transport accessory protein [Mycolicibacterium smegmatis]AWT55517.1 hypothetical protein D806_045570 [Mycolicibacterium smegmatis MKD8]